MFSLFHLDLSMTTRKSKSVVFWARLASVLLVSVLMLPATLTSCSGYKIPEPEQGPARDPFEPLVTTVSSVEGAAGDVLSIGGVNFSPILTDNIVEFRTGSDRLRGVVTSYATNGFDVIGAEFTTLEVVVPTGVRSGSLDVRAPHRESGAEQIAGSVGFSAAPVIVSTLFGNSGDQGYFRVVAGNLVPNQVILLGYDLSSVTRAIITDTQGTSVDADILQGPGAQATFTVPDGQESLRLDVPGGAGLFVDCAAGDSGVLTIDLRAEGGATVLTSNSIEVQVSLAPGADVGAAITSALVPGGVRRGDVPISFSLLQEPARTRWDVVPEYFSPAVGGYVPCTPRVPSYVDASAAIYDGTHLLAGTAGQRPQHPSLMGRGTSYTFVWASAEDLDDETLTTRIRLRATNPIPVNNAVCDNAMWETGNLVVDNRSAFEDTLVEEFETSRFYADGNATWGPAVLAASTVGEGTTGLGIVDVTCMADHIYFFDTDSGVVVDETDANLPVLILDVNDNPGSAAGEFHVRTLIIEEGADVTFVGSNPIVIRARGVGDPNATAIEFRGDYDLTGADGEPGTPQQNGAGGRGRFGGGDGGAGAFIDYDALVGITVEHVPATRGGNFGGYPGGSTTFVVPNQTTVHRAGGGGGGGHVGAGGVAAPSNNNFDSFGVLGVGGPVRGDRLQTEVVAGSGGGGGGAMVFRPQGTNNIFQPRCGSGGGAGGGALLLVADGNIVIDATVDVSGGDGVATTGAVGNGGPGGGGSAGSIAIRASGDIDVGANTLLLARGGKGAGPSPSSGDGADGRIRFESNASVNLPFTLGGFGSGFTENDETSIGEAVAPLEGGSGIDGRWDFSSFGAGTFFVDSDSNEVRDEQGALIYSGALQPGVFEIEQLLIPVGTVLRGIGVQPLVIRVSGDADIGGTIDVSGFNGGSVDVSDPTNPVAGLGGAGGPGGGRGGDGGSVSTALLHGSPGELPPLLPDQLIGSVLDSDDLPIPTGLVHPAAGGASVLTPCASDPLCNAGAGAGGGYFERGGDGAGGDIRDGHGGSPYGNELILNPLTPGVLRVGGMGGGGGGGTDAAVAGLSHVPGSGGGGGGGFLQLSVAGPLRLSSTARLLAHGGDAMQAPEGGGSGGAGAGGTILIQVPDFNELILGAGFGLTIEADAGRANVESLDYAPHPVSSGGAGSRGRIRFEHLIGTPLIESSCATIPLLAGLCPPPDIGAFETANTVRSRARSRAYATTFDGTVGLHPRLSTPTVLATLPPGSFVRVLVSGVDSSLEPFGVPTEFAPAVGDPALLDATEYVRFEYYLYTALNGAPPTIDRVELRFGVGQE